MVESLGGLGLLFGGLKELIYGGSDEEEGLMMVNLIKPVSALVLFLLTIAVTPANWPSSLSCYEYNS